MDCINDDLLLPCKHIQTEFPADSYIQECYCKKNAIHSFDEHVNSNEWRISMQTKRKEESPDDTSRYCSGKVITSPSCKQSSKDKGGKN